MATTKELTQFRTRLYSSLPGRGDALMDLLDALAGNQSARSVVEPSLSPTFRRCWSSVSKAIARFFRASSDRMAGGERVRLERRFVRTTQSLLAAPQRRGHWLFGLDATPLSRPHARCLSDRSWVHQCDGPSTGAPVTIGHQYSLVVGFPEADDPGEPAWVLPLSSRRVPSARTANEVGSLQIRALLDDPQLPWYEKLVVVMGDSAYGCLPFLGPLGDFENLVLLTRVRSNRVFHAPPEPGSRRWYGPRFRLRDRRTWTEPVETCRFCRVTPAGKRIEHRVERFADLRMRGSREQPMHRRPFDLLRVTRYDEHGQKRVAMSADELDAHLVELYPGSRYTEPAFWRDARFNRPSQPVVGICWYEARAYLRWLSEQSGLGFRLPTGVEWEAAARGAAGRRYAYGSAFDRLRCNTAQTHIRQTTPVGVFPGGDTLEGAADLTGNVSEWTSSAFGKDLDATEYPFPYDIEDGREEAEAPADMQRVSRGGSWHSSQSAAALALSRDSARPGSRNLGEGFRVVA